MDVGATSLGKGTDKSTDSTATRSATNSDINAQLIATTLQESATSRLSSLLSTLVAEPLAAAPRMPQQHTLKNTNVGEKATLPQPVVTPNFHIPPHIMGRNLNNPSEDPVSHSRRIQKPRLGVRVPYRNLTSQIVTQDELAQELLERSLKNHPVHDIPEGGDLFFAIKLTQRLASKLSPANSQAASGASHTDQSPGRSSQTVLRSDSKPSATKKDPHLLPETRELIAILEGDGDDDWIPSGTQTLHNPAKVPSTPPQPAATQINTKLDPVLEKELALKQLMEFQNMSRRRKSDKKQTPGDKPRKQRGQARKTPVNKENGQKANVIKRNSESGSKPNLNSSASKTTTNPVNAVKVTRKRKLEDNTLTAVAKKPRVSGKKSISQAKDESKGNVTDKTDGKIQRKTKAKTSLNSSSSPVGMKLKSMSAATPKENGSKSAVHKPKKSNSPSSPGKRKSPNTLDMGNTNSTINTSVNNSVSPVQFKVGMPSIHSPLLADDLPEFSRSFTTPIRTYSPKKKTPNSNNSANGQSPVTDKLREDENVAKTKGSDKVKTDHTSPPKQIEDKQSPSQKKKDIKDNTADSKKKKMSEVDRLLMDEGAINLLYEAERGESRRRSNAPDEPENLPTNQRKILKSVRRKKKDLLLKTRLVKNAVLRLSNSPSSVVSISSRITRRTEPPLSVTTLNQNEPQRKLSFESRDSVGSPASATPLDPPSPRTFVYSPQLPLPAEASRIIRRHSSSSNFSSRSASPNNIRMCDPSQITENSSKPNEVKISVSSGKANENSVKVTGQGRKKGFPIFVRKPQVIQTYQGKKKKISPAESKNANSLPGVKSSNKAPQQNREVKAPGKTLQKIAADKKRAVVVKKISISDKLKLKAEMSKNFQKGFHSGKVKVLKKALENSAKAKKDQTKEKGSTIEEETPDLSSCLAAAASAFAAEALEVREEKSSKKSGSSGTSHSSSPCPSRSSKSPTPTGRTGRKDPRIAPPLSPNAATYSNLLKTLENESQKPRKKDGEEVTKQRSSVRQNAGTYHYKDISLRRYDNLVQVILTPQSTKMKNALNLQVLRELKDALHQLKKDESCRAVLLTSTGSSFCQGVDFHSLLHTNAEKRKTAAQELAQALKEFLKILALFNKPIVAGVHGAAVGLGVTMLPFFDMVFASDKATFYTPYAKLGQVPEGAAILTLPHMFGNAVTSELLFGCRKLTASEALHFGLVTRILWPDRFQEELIPVIRSMANQSSQSMEATKALLRHSLRTKLDAALESETHLLVQHWISAECQSNFKKFLEEGDVGLQKQRLEA